MTYSATPTGSGRIVQTVQSYPSATLIEWSDFTVKDSLDTTLVEPIENRELSAKAVSVLLLKYVYKMYTVNGVIGYNTLDTNKTYTYGISEADAFSDWIIGIKKLEKGLKNVLPAKFNITQSQYDALVLFFVVTGQINKVKIVEGSFDLKSDILSGNWETVASKISYDSRDFNISRQIGSIMILGDYGQPLPRTWMRNKGIQTTRRQYEFLIDGYQIRQAEHSYYRETQKFLPNMSEMRQREVVSYYRANP